VEHRRQVWEIAAAAAPLLLVPLLAALALWRPAAIEESIEKTLLDWRFIARNALLNALHPPSVPPDILIVAIDDPSVFRLGSWPWTPARVAELTGKVALGKPRAIGLDIALHQPESPWTDQRLARGLLSTGSAFATTVEFKTGTPSTDRVPKILLDSAIAVEGPEQPPRPLEASQALLPPEPLDSAPLLGHGHYRPNPDGKLRRDHLYLRYGGSYIPSLALQTARIAEGYATSTVRILGARGVELNGRLLPTDDRGRLFINYYGGEGTFPHYSAASVILGDTPPEIFKDAVVFIGTTGIAAYDLVKTPFTDVMPSIEKDATVAANILAGDFLRDAPPAANLLVVLATGAAVFLFCRHRRAALSLLSFVGLILVLVAADFALFLQNVQLALAYPLLLVVSQGAATVAWQYLAEGHAERRMRRMFSSYVSERVVEGLIANPEMARLGGERREVTILFSDIRGFTSFSEKHPPEEVVGTLNEFLGTMTESVFNWEGTLDKFIGDSVMAFWNAPLPQPDHAERALRCALEMCGRLDQLNAAWAAAGRPVLEIGIGINTGQVLVGNIGAEGKKMDYTVIGDQVNLCSRIEGLTKELQSRILVAESTYALLRPLLDSGAFGHLDVVGPETVAVKGKEEPVRVFRVAARAGGRP
jgi:adenylate cyclase